MDINLFSDYPIEIFFSTRINNLNELKTIPFLANQKHTDEVYLIKTNDDIKNKPIADSIITNIKNIPIGVKTADCVPILMYDKKEKVISAIHSGWQGSVKKIALNTIEEMSIVYGSKPQNIIVIMGPAICGKCYFVGIDVIEKFKKIVSYDFYKEKQNKFFIDLREVNKNLLIKKGVEEKNIFIHNDCTYCKNNQYQSYRYHKNTSSFQISYIMLK